MSLPFETLAEMTSQNTYKYGVEDGIIQMMLFQVRNQLSLLKMLVFCVCKNRGMTSFAASMTMQRRASAKEAFLFSEKT